MEPYTLVMFGWITGSVIAGNPQFFDSKAACMAVKDRAEKQFESGGFEGCLEVLGEAAVAADPGEEALDDPAPGLDGEADLVGVLANDLDGDGGGAATPLPAVAAVGEDLRDKGKGVARGRQHGPAAVAVLDVGRVRLQHQGTTVGVDGMRLSRLASTTVRNHTSPRPSTPAPAIHPRQTFRDSLSDLTSQ